MAVADVHLLAFGTSRRMARWRARKGRDQAARVTLCQRVTCACPGRACVALRVLHVHLPLFNNNKKRSTMDVDIQDAQTQEVEAVTRNEGKKPMIAPVDDAHPFDLDSYISAYSGAVNSLSVPSLIFLDMNYRANGCLQTMSHPAARPLSFATSLPSCVRANPSWT